MIKFLIVEDDEDKAQQLEYFVSQLIGDATVTIARSLQTGLTLALEGSWNFLFLDMTMTNFDRNLSDDGGRPHHFAGREILRQLKREGIVIPVVIVTQFDRFGEESEELTLEQLEMELFDKFLEFRGIVRYRANVDDWKSQLEEIIMDIFETKSDGE